MSTLEPLYQRLWRRQTDQRLRAVSFSWALIWRASLNIPTTRCVDGQDRNFGGLQSRDDGGEGFADLAGKGEAEDRIDYVVGR